MKTLYIKLTIIALLFVGNSFAQVHPQLVCGCVEDPVEAYAIISAGAPMINGVTCSVFSSSTSLLHDNCYTYIEDSSVVCEGTCEWKWKAVYECIATFDSISPPIVFMDSARGTYTTPCSKGVPGHHKKENEGTIKEIKNKQIDNLNLFPNPIKQGEELTMVLPTTSRNDRMVKIKIYNVIGEEVLNKSVLANGNNIKISFPYVKEGNYVVVIEDPENAMITRKSVGVVH